MCQLLLTNKYMKTLVTTVIGTFVLTGCSSTLTVGPKANDSSYLGADASTKGASVTLPLVKASVKTALPEDKKKK
jgi:uncharacterized lipoprotein YajG